MFFKPWTRSKVKETTGHHRGRKQTRQNTDTQGQGKTFDDRSGGRIEHHRADERGDVAVSDGEPGA